MPPLSEMKRRSVPAGSKSSWFCSFFAASLSMPSSVVSAVILAILTVARSIESLTVMRMGVEEMGGGEEMTHPLSA